MTALAEHRRRLVDLMMYFIFSDLAPKCSKLFKIWRPEFYEPLSPSYGVSRYHVWYQLINIHKALDEGHGQTEGP